MSKELEALDRIKIDKNSVCDKIDNHFEGSLEDIKLLRYYYTLKIVKIDLPYKLDIVELITKFYKGDIKNEKS